MNDNQIFLSYLPEENTSPLDLKDLLAQILLQWKRILLCMVIFGIIGIGFSFFRANKKAASTASIDQSLASARGKLNSNVAEDIENLHDRILVYQTYQRHLQENFTTYVSNATNSDQYIVLLSSYYVSSSIDHMDEVLPSLLFSEDDYDAMREIVSDETSLAPIYNRVTVTSSSNNDSNNAIVITSEENNTRSDYLFLVTLYGDSEEQCKELLKVVDAAMNRAIESFKALDQRIEISSVETRINKNSRLVIQAQIKASMDIINNIDNQINTLKNNQVAKLTGDDLAYYNLLLKADQVKENSSAEEEPKVEVSWKKWLVAGAFGGALLAMVIIIVLYLYNGKIKISDEAEFIFRKKTLHKIWLPGKNNLFAKCANALTGRDSIPLEDKLKMISADLQILMEKNNADSLYLLCDPSDKSALEMAKQVKEQLASAGKTDIILGDPSLSISELEKLSNSQGAVIFTELKKSRLKVLSQWQELCERYKLPVQGIISTERCW